MQDELQQWQEWVGKLVEGDDQVVADFWRQYGDRLQRLAGKCLSNQVHRRVGPEDVVQSACRTFLRRAQGGQFELTDSESLWRLLCAITITKVRWHTRFHRRQKRHVDRERPLQAPTDEDSRPVREVAARQPTPAEAAEFSDQFEQLLNSLDEEEQQLVQLKLDQCTNFEIADRLGCSERTVRRILKRVQSNLRQLLQHSS